MGLLSKGEKGKSSELDEALTPVASRLLKQFALAKERFTHATEGSPAAKEADHEMKALLQFRKDIGGFVHAYGFLCQIFDFANTDIEKRSIFFRLLAPLLTFGREREGIDLSALRLTAYTLKDLGQQKLPLTKDDAAKIDPLQAIGSGEIQDKQKVALQELIAQVNGLFEGEISPGDKLVYVNSALRSKLLENPALVSQAVNNTEEQFANSPDLDHHLEGAIIDSMEAFREMGRQALTPQNQRAIKEVLLGPAKLYQGLIEAHQALRAG